MTKDVRALMRCSVFLLVAALSFADLGRAQSTASYRDCPDCPELVVLPAGTFTMGSPTSEKNWAVSRGAAPASVSDEAPQHRVSVRSVALGKYDVTRGEYAAFVRATGHPDGDGCGHDGAKWNKLPNASWRNPGFAQSDRDPVVCVSWHDARAYIAWLNTRVHTPGSPATDGRYRLPAESEWEYAARAGTTAAFWWGDKDVDVGDHAWYESNADAQTHPVGGKPANAFGLHDMAGNVWQWTEDCYADDYTGAPSNGSAAEAPANCMRVDRGGSWLYPSWLLRSATRERNPADYRDVVMGFRVAKTLAPVQGGADSLSEQVREFARVSTPRTVLEHVRIIDGTGAAAVDDQNIRIDGGKITSITAGADEPPADGTTVLDMRGYSVMPGIVGMHDHLAYIALPNLAPDYSFAGPGRWMEMSFSAPRLYLANGVTTIRSVASIEPNTDIKLARAIEAGLLVGPHMDVTGPFLEGPNPLALPMPALTGPDDARQTVAFWADHGVTSFKAYQDITRDELRAVVDEAHKRGLKVTGHLCSVTYQEAAEIGIDNLEHGFSVNTANDPGKMPDTCSASGGDYTLEHLSADDASRLIRLLIQHHVAITSTLPLHAAIVARESSPDHGPPMPAEVLEAMSPHARDQYFYWRNRPIAAGSKAGPLLRKDMELQRAFVAAGGLLMAGPDPVGLGGLVPGFADQSEIELLVEAGFAPVQAIRIATLNGATYLGRQNEIGSIAVGKHADLVVMRGNPAARIADIENVELVFKDGVGYDSKKLLASVKGRYGEY
jgi:formylglycine-generating enzyme required for sulfatase activity/imidazolonepropionase-like amidohydrolase